MNGPAEIPTYDQLVKDPGKALTLSPEVARTFLIGWAPVQPLLMVSALKDTGTTEAPADPEKYLTVTQVVAQYGVREKWLYRHKRKLPHSQPSQKVLLFPEKQLRKWFANQKMM